MARFLPFFRYAYIKHHLIAWLALEARHEAEAEGTMAICYIRSIAACFRSALRLLSVAVRKLLARFSANREVILQI